MHRHRKTAFLFLAPFLTVFVAFYLTPVFYAIYLSLFIRKRVGIGPAKEVFGGLANYIRAVQDGDFLNGLKNMFIFGVVQVPVMLGLAIEKRTTPGDRKSIAPPWSAPKTWLKGERFGEYR